MLFAHKLRTASETSSLSKIKNLCMTSSKYDKAEKKSKMLFWVTNPSHMMYAVHILSTCHDQGVVNFRAFPTRKTVISKGKLITF